MDTSNSPQQQERKTISKNLMHRHARKICPECKGDRGERLLGCQSCYNQYSSRDSEPDMKRARSDCIKPQDPTSRNHTEKSSELDENRQSGMFEETGTTFHHTLFMEQSLVERRIHIDSSDAGSSNEEAIIHLRSFHGMNSNHERKDDARSEGSRNDDQITVGMTGDLLRTRDLLASLDLYVSQHQGSSNHDQITRGMTGDLLATRDLLASVESFLSPHQGSSNHDQITRGMTGDLLGTRDLLASLDLYVSPHQGSPNHDQISRGMPGDLLGTRDLLASLESFLSPHASLNIDLNKPLDFGFDEFHLPEPSQVFDLSVDSICKNKENVSILQLCRTENSSLVRAVADKGEALADSSPVSMSTSSSYQNNNLQVFPESGSHNMPPTANNPISLQSSQPDTPWSGVELDFLGSV